MPQTGNLQQAATLDAELDISIVIPVRNNLDFTKQCLEGIAETAAGLKYEVIIVDNASEDDTPRFLEAQASERLRWIRNSRNETYSHANNQGAAIARGRYLILLNNDTKPLPGWLNAFVREFENNPTVGIQGARLLYENHTIQHAGMVFGARPRRREEPYHAYLCADPNAPHVTRKRLVQFVTGACLAIRRDLYQQLGGFDEDYVYGWEDTDLCMKVQEAGLNILYNPYATLYHFESITKKAQDSLGDEYLDNEAPHEQRNRARFFAKWGNVLKRDAEEFYAEDGFVLTNGRLVSVAPQPGLQLPPQVQTSFDARFWERNYPNASTILVRCGGAIGDSLTIGAIVANLKQRHPHLDIWVSGDQRVEWIFRHHPAIKGYVEKGSEQERDRLESVDVLVDYHDIIGRMADFYNGIGYMDVLANLAGVRLDARGLIYTVEPAEADWAKQELKRLSAHGLKIGLQFTTSKDAKRSYPHGARVVEILQERHPEATFILLGQEPLGEENPRVYDCAERQVAFRHQMALAFECDAFVTIDSAFFHIGHNLCRKPTLTLFGVTNPDLSGNPEAGFVPVRNEALSCLSCYWQTPCNIECMGQLSPEAVAKRFEQMMTARETQPLVPLPQVTSKVTPLAQPEAIVLQQIKARMHPVRLRLLDPGQTLPDYALDWNGISIDQPPRFGVRWEGSQFVQHSLALINREVCLGLIDAGHDVSILPFDPSTFGPEVDPRFRKLAERIHAPLPPPADVHVRHQWPPNFNAPPEGCWVMIQPWEFGGAPQAWVEPMATLVDEVWVPSHHVRDGYVRSGIPAERVKVIPNGVDSRKFHPDVAPFPLKTRKTFKFLFVGGTIGRKGIDILLETYANTFTADHDVCLVIKDMGGNSFYQGMTAQQSIAAILARPNAPEIEYLDAPLGDEELVGLYTACDCLVHPYRGEGFGLPIAEAMSCAMPVIVTGYGACLDFCDERTAYLIPAREVPYHSQEMPSSLVGYWWAEPDREALRERMWHVASNHEEARQIGQRARERILEKFQWSHVTAQVIERLKTLAKQTPIRYRASDPFQPGTEPMAVEGRRGLAFFHHPTWAKDAWKEVISTYCRAFGPHDDVCLMLWLDPEQGLSEATVSERIASALTQAGIDPDLTPDLVLLTEPLDRSGLASLYTAADWIVPAGDDVQKQRAARLGIPTIERLSLQNWRASLNAQSLSLKL